jgi:hypothetical protein
MRNQINLREELGLPLCYTERGKLPNTKQGIGEYGKGREKEDNSRGPVQI